MGLHSPENLDMFDVAVGDCEFSEYLLQRFSALDLQTKISLDPNDKFEEIITYVPPPPVAIPPDQPPIAEPEPPAAETPADTDEMAILIANFQAAAALANFQSAVAAFQEQQED